MMKIKNIMSDQAVRLKKIRLYLGMTRHQFGEIIGISQFTIRSWENGEKNFTSDGIQRVIAALNEHLNFPCSYEWLFSGEGVSPLFQLEKSHFQDTESICFDPIEEKILNEVVTFKRSNESVNVIVVSNHSFSPIADIGDYIGLLPIDLNNIEDYVGKIVYLALYDETSEFGVLYNELNGFRITHLTNKADSVVTKHDIHKSFQFIWFRKVFQNG